MTAAVATKPTAPAARRSERARLLVQPIVVVILRRRGARLGVQPRTDRHEQGSLNAANIATLTWQHVLITVRWSRSSWWRSRCRWASCSRGPGSTGWRRSSSASPTSARPRRRIGVIVLFFLSTGTNGFWSGCSRSLFYSLLPVLRNTMVGIQQVDPSLIDAGRGQGMSPAGVLRRVELPLAVPLILAGLRTSLVLAVGTATLAFFVNGGGLGNPDRHRIQVARQRDPGGRRRAGGRARAARRLAAARWPRSASARRGCADEPPPERDRRDGPSHGCGRPRRACGLRIRGAVPLSVEPGSIQPVPELRGRQDHRRLQGLHRADHPRLHHRVALCRPPARRSRDLTNIQGSNSTRHAQLDGQIDVTWEYTGTGWINYLGNEIPIPDPTAQFEAVRDEDLDRTAWCGSTRPR